MFECLIDVGVFECVGVFDWCVGVGAFACVGVFEYVRVFDWCVGVFA